MAALPARAAGHAGAPAKTFASFRLGPLLGQGPLATVYHATPAAGGEPCALKIFDPGRVKAAQVARFGALLRAAAAIPGSGAPAPLEIRARGPSPHIAMVLAQDVGLEILFGRAPLPWPKVAVFGQVLARRLGALHAAGQFHGELKPSNLGLRADGGRTMLTLLDVGAHALGPTPPQDGTLFYDITAAPVDYRAPEQLLGGLASASADLYAFGLLLYTLLAGNPPFAGTPLEIAHAHLRTAPPPFESALAGRAPQPPRPLVAVIEALLAKDPKARPPAQAVFSSVAAILAGLALEGGQGARAPSTPRPIAGSPSSDPSGSGEYWGLQPPHLMGAGATGDTNTNMIANDESDESDESEETRTLLWVRAPDDLRAPETPGPGGPPAGSKAWGARGTPHRVDEVDEVDERTVPTLSPAQGGLAGEPRGQPPGTHSPAPTTAGGQAPDLGTTAGGQAPDLGATVRGQAPDLGATVRGQAPDLGATVRGQAPDLGATVRGRAPVDLDHTVITRAPGGPGPPPEAPEGPRSETVILPPPPPPSAEESASITLLPMGIGGDFLDEDDSVTLYPPVQGRPDPRRGHQGDHHHPAVAYPSGQAGQEGQGDPAATAGSMKARLHEVHGLLRAGLAVVQGPWTPMKKLVVVNLIALAALVTALLLLLVLSLI